MVCVLGGDFFNSAFAKVRRAILLGEGALYPNKG